VASFASQPITRHKYSFNPIALTYNVAKKKNDGNTDDDNDNDNDFFK
jgi:hypothetical protein